MEIDPSHTKESENEELKRRKELERSMRSADSSHQIRDKIEKEKKKKIIITFIDPCKKEELLVKGAKTIISMTKFGQFCAIDKWGGVPLKSRHIL